MQHANTLFIFAGPNGSGKSSLVRTILERYPLKYVCADDIEKTVLRDVGDDEERSRQALCMAETAIRRLIENGAFCGYETVLSSDYKWPILEYARTHGMRIIVFFIATKDVEINCRRVAERKAQGGHAVPPEKIRSRYTKSIERLPRLLQMADAGFVFDNSAEGRHVCPRLLLEMNGEYIGYDPEIVATYTWAMACIDALRSEPRYKLFPQEALAKMTVKDWTEKLLHI